MGNFFKYFKQITLRNVLYFIAKIGVIVLCRYLLDEPPTALFKSRMAVDLLNGILFFLIFNVVISVMALFVISIYAVNKHVVHIRDNNFILGIKRIVTMLNVILAIVAIMKTVSINPLEFVTSISIAAAAFALLSKDYITNMINGLIIMFSDKLSLGNYIVVDKNKGKIIDITFLNVVILDDEGDIHYIPNTTMLTQVVINHSHLLYKKVYFEFDIDNRLGLDMDFLYEKLWQEMVPYTDYIEPNSFLVRPKEIEKDFIKYRLVFHIKTMEIYRERIIKKQLLQTIITLITQHSKGIKQYAKD